MKAEDRTSRRKMKNKDWLYVIPFIVLIIAAAVWFVAAPTPTISAQKAGPTPPASLTSDIRLENEAKLVVPMQMTEQVWDYLLARLINDKTFIQSLDPTLDSYWYDEIFTDAYFDTPDLTMLGRNSGIRYRIRENLTDPSQVKSGRELIQIKLSSVSGDKFVRGEIKFDVTHPTKLNEQEDMDPILGIMKRKERAKFIQALSDIKVDAYSLHKILVINQHRRSIYITRGGAPFISIRLDQDESKLLWADWKHVEIEPELNEIPYTAASDSEKAAMEVINLKLLKDIQNKFPEIKLDLTPKYTKAFNYLESQIPRLRFMIANNLISPD
jgi:hypothetical protein